MLNLRLLGCEEDSMASVGSYPEHSQFSHPVFRHPSSFLGNIGEPLDYERADGYMQDVASTEEAYDHFADEVQVANSMSVIDA